MDMIRMFHSDPGGALVPAGTLDAASWVDLVAPDAETLARIAAACGIQLPGRAEMEEIELSSRLYHLGGTDYLTLVLPALTETDEHQSAPVTFALAGARLITIRYHAPRPFQTYPMRADRSPYGTGSAREVLFGLMDEIIDRLADILEATDRRIETAGRELFTGGAIGAREMRSHVATLGQAVRLVSDVHNSLLTIERAINFLGRARADGKIDKVAARALKVLSADTQSLLEHAAFLNQKLALLLDASFGLTTIQQNAVTTTFTLVAVLFLPPTLIGTIFGMNFAEMPWIGQPWGFAAALVAMAASSVLSYLFFRWRNFI